MKSKPPIDFSKSVYTPFLRRFTDERALELRELQQLYAHVTGRYHASVWAKPDILERVSCLVVERVTALVTFPTYGEIGQALDRCQSDIVRLETTLFQTPLINDWTLSLKEQVDLRRFLRAQEHFLAHEEKISGLFVTALVNLFAGLISTLPKIEGSSHLTAPLYAFVDCNDVVDRIIGTVGTEQLADSGLFAALNERIYHNICAASGVRPYEKHTKTLVTAADSPLRSKAVVDAYLAGTPFHALFSTPIPFSFPRNLFKEHAAVFAHSGGGKTVTLQNLIVDFLKQDDPPAMFIMDSMGALLRKIERLAIIPDDRLLILDPADPPALNFFKLKAPPAKRLELFFYLFKAIDQSLTPRQATMVSYLVELMQTIPNATLDTLRQVCESKTPLFPEAIAKLEPIAQDFFANQFHGRGDQLVTQTKQQIAARLYTVGRNRVFNAMFSASENRFDALDCIRNRKIVLIDTNRAEGEHALGDEGSTIFGRFIIAQVMAAALQRKEHERQLALLIIDEAKQYLDEQAEKILSDARQFGLGMILATQSPHQLPEGVQREVANNTSMKMLGSVSYAVASQLARDMHTTPEFIQSMQARPPSHVEFATYVRGLTPQALKLTIPIGTLEQQPTLSEAEWRARRARNKAAMTAREIPKSTSAPVTHENVKVQSAQTSDRMSEREQTSTAREPWDTEH